MRKIAQSLSSFEIWLVAIPLAASLVSVRFLPIAILAALFFGLVRFIAHDRFSVRTNSDIPILVLSLTLLITLWITAFPDITNVQVLRLLSGIALFYSIVNWSSNIERINWLINGIILAGLILAIIAPLSVEWSAKLAFIPAEIYQPFKIIIQDTIHPNVMAGSLALILPISAAWVLFAWLELTTLEKTLAITSSLAMSFILLLTQSRGAWAAVFLVILFYPIFRWKWGWILSVLGILAAASAIYVVGYTEVMNALVSGGNIRGSSSRIEIWERSLFMIRDFPFTGVGMGCFTKVADSLYPFTTAEPGTINHAHNLFLQIGVDLGLPGLLAWISIIIVNLIQAWKSYQTGVKDHQLRMQATGFAITGSLLTMFLHGLTDSVVWGMVRSAPLVWAILGIGSSLYLHKQRKY